MDYQLIDQVIYILKQSPGEVYPQLHTAYSLIRSAKM